MVISSKYLLVVVDCTFLCTTSRHVSPCKMRQTLDKFISHRRQRSATFPVRNRLLAFSSPDFDSFSSIAVAGRMNAIAHCAPAARHSESFNQELILSNGPSAPHISVEKTLADKNGWQTRPFIATSKRFPCSQMQNAISRQSQFAGYSSMTRCISIYCLHILLL